MPYLILNNEKTAYELRKDVPFTAGRSTECSLALPLNIKASRKHCVFSFDGEFCTVSDSGSTNGTWVNGEEVQEPRVLSPGDRIEVGGVILTYALEPELSVPEPPAIQEVSDGETVIAPGVAVEEWQVVKKLSETAFAQRYILMKPENPEHPYLMKWYKKPLLPEAVHQFTTRIKKLANAPEGISPYYRGGVFNGRCFYVTDWLENPDLAFRISRKAPMSNTQSLVTTAALIEVLQYAYAYFKLPHGNLNPGNILYGENDRIVIGEFGLADWENTVFPGGCPEIPPWYVSPEQLEGGSATWKSDVYSLGVSLFHMLTGVLPFYAPDLETLKKIKLTKPFPLPFERNPEIRPPASVIELLLRMTNRNPDDRYASYDELVKAVALVQARTMP